MSKDFNTYFVRHTSGLEIDEETRERLWAEERVAIHFPKYKGKLKDQDNTRLNPGDYDGSAVTAIKKT